MISIGHHLPSWVAAASSSAYGDREQVTLCAGEESHSQEQNPFGDTSTKSARDSALDQFEETLTPDPHRFDLFDDFCLASNGGWAAAWSTWA